MKILLIGCGGREHALAWKLSKSPKVSKIYVSTGNAGTYLQNKCENINITDINELVSFAKQNNIYLTIVGNEQPLIDGITDKFSENGLRCFGPDKAGAMLEGSKSFSKEFMKKYGVKTADYQTFDNPELALNYINKCEFPVVIKADGLAGGKGVVIAQNLQQSQQTIKDYMINDTLKGSGKKIIIEEFLDGVEASILSITDGGTIIPFVSAKDHKQIFDGNNGENTGGMGVLAPNPYVTDEVMKNFEQNIMNKTLLGIKQEKFNFIGIIFFGLMITQKGVYLLEYNVRMGDPETQSVLPLMESDLFEIIDNALNKKLSQTNIKWKNDICVNIVLASKGYPQKFETDYEITYNESLKDSLFLAGAKIENGILKTNGGRVLSIIGTGENVEQAINNAYKNVELVNFKDCYYRKDIGKIN